VSSTRASRARSFARLAALALGLGVGVVLCAIGCGDDDHAPYTIIGAACRSTFDCAPGVDCLTGGDFPEGTCALPCRGHFDCPPSTACVDREGGVCLPRCNNELQCRPRYQCRGRDDRDGAGESLVCIR
jgi:hypothetical protein